MAKSKKTEFKYSFENKVFLTDFGADQSLDIFEDIFNSDFVKGEVDFDNILIYTDEEEPTTDEIFEIFEDTNTLDIDSPEVEEYKLVVTFELQKVATIKRKTSFERISE